MGYTADDQGWQPDVATGAYPVIDEYAGYEGFRDALRDSRGAVNQLGSQTWTRPVELHHGSEQPATGRRFRPRPDQWGLACGALAGAIAVVVAFVTAAGH